jgi:hypothetical protein
LLPTVRARLSKQSPISLPVKAYGPERRRHGLDRLVHDPLHAFLKMMLAISHSATKNASTNISDACNMLDVKQNGSYIAGMNKLPLAKRVQILSMLCEGSSMRSIGSVSVEFPSPTHTATAALGQQRLHLESR